MLVAPKIVVLVRDPDGYGAAIAAALQPATGSHLKREDCLFEFPLEKYGLKDSKASGELVQFVDPRGSPQVSIFVIPEYAPPVAACSMNELLQFISCENQSGPPVLIIPLVTKLLTSYHEVKHKATSGHLPILYGTEIGAATDFTRVLLDGTTKPPQALQIRSEPIACLLQMVRVLKLPTVLLVASSGRHRSSDSTDHDLEVLNHIGNHLASHINLDFSKESLQEKGLQKSRVVQQPWRELYG